MDDIKRANKLYGSDTIFTKTELLIPATDDNREMGELVQLGDQTLDEMRRSVSPEVESSSPKATTSDFFAKYEWLFMHKSSVGTAPSAHSPSVAIAVFAAARVLCFDTTL